MLDLEKLLAPISDDAPTGVDLRLSAGDDTFAQLTELKRAADPALDEPAKDPQWPAVARACEEALAARSKDLQLAAWLTEALVHTEGLAGLEAGLQLVFELLTRFWDGLHPGYEDGKIELPVRARWLSWLASSNPTGFLPAIKQIGIVGDGANREDWLGWYHYEEAERVDATAAVNQARYEEMVASGMTTGERWAAALAVTPIERLRDTLSALRESEARLAELGDVCEQRFEAEDAPSLVDLRNLLSDMREYLESQVGEGPQVEEGAGEVTGATRAGATVSSGPITSRQEALARLREVAEFFRRSEPHSPVSHLVDRAARWGQMSFEEVLRDVVKSSDALDQIWETLGIKRPEE